MRRNAGRTVTVVAALGPAVLVATTLTVVDRRDGRFFSVTWAGDVSPALGSNAARSAPSKVQVFQGSAESKEYHF